MEADSKIGEGRLMGYFVPSSSPFVSSTSSDRFCRIEETIESAVTSSGIVLLEESEDADAVSDGLLSLSRRVSVTSSFSSGDCDVSRNRLVVHRALAVKVRRGRRCDTTSPLKVPDGTVV